MTPYEAVTLITCGGEWDSSISEYDERTVARATRVPDESTPAAQVPPNGRSETEFG
jgi:hypothetical protein